ncbi:unnamed protein product [Vicia faba]|uniref:Uncharacterized protein n=1 Tax=Vicia faba TaxID=3906 RepID=A0AAV1B559_VICFA|nr:unnamed protein product [Vicia faba]
MGVCHVLGTGAYLGLPSMIGRKVMIKSVLQEILAYVITWEKLTCTKKEGGLGFRDLRTFIMEMVAKQGWFLMSKLHALVSRIFKARYFPKTSFFDANIGYNPSFIWRGIWKVREVLTLGYRWSIGGGSNIKVMNEPWLRGGEGE